MDPKRKVERSITSAVSHLKEARVYEQDRLIAAIEANQRVSSTLLARLAEMISELERILAGGAVDVSAGTLRPLTAKTSRSETKRRKRRYVGGDYTPTKDFRLPLLKALDVLGGAAQSTEVMKLVEDSMSLKAADYKMIRGARPVERWRNSLSWLRHDMTKEGLIALDPNRKGRWVLTSSGRRALRTEEARRNHEGH